MRFEIITELADLEKWRTPLEQLFATTALRNPHMTYAWYTQWWKTYGADYRLRFCLAHDGNDLLGCAPLMEAEYTALGVLPYRLLTFIGTELSDFADIVTRHDDLEIKNALIAFVLKEMPWDEISLKNISAHSNTLLSLAHNMSARQYVLFRPVTRCLYIDLGQTDWESYYRQLSRNHRHELQKRLNKFNRLEHWGCDFNNGYPPEQLFEIMRGLNTSRSQEMGWEQMFESTEFRQFFQAMMTERNSEYEVLYSLLYANEVPVSYTLGFVSGDTYYHWSIGFNPDYDELSPNKVHHKILIETCFNRGLREFNFMRGDSEYKFRWTQSYRYNYKVTFLRRTGMRGLANHIRMFKEEHNQYRLGSLLEAINRPWLRRIYRSALATPKIKI